MSCSSNHLNFCEIRMSSVWSDTSASFRLCWPLLPDGGWILKPDYYTLLSHKFQCYSKSTTHVWTRHRIIAHKPLTTVSAVFCVIVSSVCWDCLQLSVKQSRWERAALRLRPWPSAVDCSQWWTCNMVHWTFAWGTKFSFRPCPIEPGNKQWMRV